MGYLGFDQIEMQYMEPPEEVEHCMDCPQYEDADMNCECDDLYPSQYDIELEKLGL
tara:strand:+ start:433 stop:600 length:168 start_codon:yes stop_codon:yes gene_type:complete